jgi:hypothetical protein
MCINNLSIPERGDGLVMQGEKAPASTVAGVRSG